MKIARFFLAISIFYLFTSFHVYKKELLYVYDPLCGWCYGFSPVIKKFAQENKDTYEIEVISGGMMLGDRAGEIGKVAPYIKWAYKDVEKATGVTFGKVFLDTILEKGTAYFSSLKPSIALTVFKSYYPEKALEYTSSIQKSIYYDGIEPHQELLYATLASSYEIDKEVFIRQMQDSAFIKQTFQEFELSKTFRVDGFPSVFLHQGNTIQLISEGYVNFDAFMNRLEKFIHK